MTDKGNRGCWKADGSSKRGYTRRRAKERAHEGFGPGWRRIVQVYSCDECGWYHIGRNNWHGKSRADARGDA